MCLCCVCAICGYCLETQEHQNEIPHVLLALFMSCKTMFKFQESIPYNDGLCGGTSALYCLEVILRMKKLWEFSNILHEYTIAHTKSAFSSFKMGKIQNDRECGKETIGGLPLHCFFTSFNRSVFVCCICLGVDELGFSLFFCVYGLLCVFIVGCGSCITHSCEIFSTGVCTFSLLFDTCNTLFALRNIQNAFTSK